MRLPSADSWNSIGKSDNELGRMLEVLRFWFTKDLVRGMQAWKQVLD